MEFTAIEKAWIPYALLVAVELAALLGYLFYGRHRKAAIVIATAGLLCFFPFKNWFEVREKKAYAEEAWAHFRKLCEEKAGEKIYKSFDRVRSVLIEKPLPMATEKDSYDQYWYGDPYSAEIHGRRGVLEAAVLAIPNAPISRGKSGRGFDFVEVRISGSTIDSNSSIDRVFYPEGAERYSQVASARSVSRFSIAWEDISSPKDRKYWVAGSRLVIFDKLENIVVAERIGFFIESGFGSTAGQRRPWMASKGSNTTCPYSHTWSDRMFVLKVLSPD